MARFRESLEAAALLIEQGVVRDVIIDLHGLPDVCLADQCWLATSWLPRVSGAAVQQAALVMPPIDAYNHLVVESLLQAGRHFMHYDIQFFNSSTEALDWLIGHEHPAQQYRLEAEWTSEAA
ncbi:hypothetical protein DNI29_10800 [Hymenobacter sediminis]|uniref:hypothetical protein n=1 Tax=Hymenobacter sediminis TaxID=2218621 RepID=UPI000DA64E24|nr:hypothetical protein [Hymenobacter sediminis]RPD47915.1 hypothetical protein DNI29_10800 [Hymenobacter sediminis]